MWVAGDADGEGVAGDAPGDVVGEGGVGSAAGVGVAGGGDGVGAAGVALLDGVSCVALVVRVLLVMVLGVAPAIPGGGTRGWKWFVGSPVLAVLVASGVWACPLLFWRGC